MNKQSLLDMKNKLEKLICGIDPTTNVKYTNDVSINHQNNKILFKDIISILDDIIDEKLVPNDRRRKKSFSLSKEKVKKIEISDEPISISAFVHRINSISELENMKKLKATDITLWLEKHGYISKIIELDDCLTRELTEKSDSIGISSISKINQYGNSYNVLLYDINAQRFILEHLNDILSD